MATVTLYPERVYEMPEQLAQMDRLGRTVAADANRNAHIVTGRLSGRLPMGLLSGYHHIANPRYTTIFTFVPYAMAEELGAVHEHWIQEPHPHLRPAVYQQRTFW